MITATTLNKSEIRGSRGGLDAVAAALGILLGSLWISHTGLVGVFKAGELAGVMTMILISLSYLQWKTMGRARAARLTEGRNSARARMVAAQAAFLFVLESTLNTIGVVILAKEAGADWGSGPALMFAIGIAAGIAWLNLTVKFVSCEPLVSAEPRAVILEDEPPPAARVPNVYDLDDVRRARELATSDEREGLRSIVAGESAHRAEEYERHLSRIDPVTKKFRAKTADPKRRRKAA